MIRIDQLNGNTIKKLIDAQIVRKQYENKHVNGSGNFGIFIRMKNKYSYTISGDYGKDGVIYNMRIRTTYGNESPSDPIPAQDIKKINDALYNISIGNDEKPVSKSGQKIQVKKVTILWYEGKIGDKYPLEFKSIKDANHWILQNAYRDAPKTGGYNKHKYMVEWVDGQTYTGRLDVKYPGLPDNETNIGEAIKSFQEYYLKQPDTSLKDKKEIREFLDSYELGL